MPKYNSGGQAASLKRKKIAVFLGGQSPEHDVSVITGLQALNALDTLSYDPFPVYISPEGQWYLGEALRNRSNYCFHAESRRQLNAVTLDVNASRDGQGCLLMLPSKPWQRIKRVCFDVALIALHGGPGEDGSIQGLLEVARVPYTGVRIKGASLLMDKVVSKLFFQSLGIPVLPFGVIKRPHKGYLVSEASLQASLGDLRFPCIVKPVHLGSSIGVAKVDCMLELQAALPAIFEMDDSALLEPFVPHLVEYNLAVARFRPDQYCTEVSAIERPKTSQDVLDFKEKYKSGGGSKGDGKGKLGGAKLGGGSTALSQGMLSLTREINPDLPAPLAQSLKAWAVAMFDALGGTGAPRIDFMSNKETGEVWMNEVNSTPGSLGYFLWEAAEDPILFTDFLTYQVEEAIRVQEGQILSVDPVPEEARLLDR